MQRFIRFELWRIYNPSGSVRNIAFSHAEALAIVQRCRANGVLARAKFIKHLTVPL